MKPKPKLTKWYRVKEFYPKHSGWYDYRGEGIGEIRACWTGASWVHRLSSAPGGVASLFPLRNDEWRGLARRPNER